MSPAERPLKSRWPSKRRVYNAEFRSCFDPALLATQGPSARWPHAMKSYRMKCQQCDKSATFHITELTGGKPQELHLCEEHARQYLTQQDDEPAVAPSLAGVLAHQLAVGQTAEELARLDQRACPVCGITFYEFRNHGRLGCPHDYVCFQQELEPLIVNIHGDTEHVGKRPGSIPREPKSARN